MTATISLGNDILPLRKVLHKCISRPGSGRIFIMVSCMNAILAGRGDVFGSEYATFDLSAFRGMSSVIAFLERLSPDKLSCALRACTVHQVGVTQSHNFGASGHSEYLRSDAVGAAWARARNVPFEHNLAGALE